MSCHARTHRGPIALALLGGLAASCASTHSDEVAGFRESWHSGDAEAAMRALDGQIAESAGVDAGLVRSTNALDSRIDTNRGDTCLFLMERGMVSLAQGQLQDAIDLFIRGRDGLDARLNSDFGSYFTDITSSLYDEAATDYSGADYEHLLVRSMLSLADLVAGDGQAETYAFQFIEKQEEILGMTYDVEGVDYEPRQQYERVAFGHYLRGVLDEREGGTDVEQIYGLASQYSGHGVELIEASLQRVTEGERWAEPGHGVLHVFALAGRGPYLEEKEVDGTGEVVTALAQIGLAVAQQSGTPLAQDRVPVPGVVRKDATISPVSVSVDGQSHSTESILDLNAIAEQQLEANEPMVTARAVVRRSLISAGIDEVEDRSGFSMGGVGLGLNLGKTMRERADTRSWESLPAEIHAARIELPAGEHEITIGGETRRVNIRAAQDSFALLVQPNLSRSGFLYFDPASMVMEPEPTEEVAEEAAEEATEEAAAEPAGE